MSIQPETSAIRNGIVKRVICAGNCGHVFYESADSTRWYCTICQASRPNTPKRKRVNREKHN